MELTANKKIYFFLAVAVLLWFLIYIPGLGDREIHGNEPKRVLPAIAILDSGDWITPQLAGERYYKKPPLINWMIATAFIIFGDRSEFAARLPSAFFVLAFVVFVMLMPSGFLDLNGKFITSLAFLTSVGVLDKGRLIEIDASYASVTGIAMLSWLNLYTLKKHGALLWILPFAIVGIGLLLKGPVILVLFYFTVLSVLLYERNIKALRSPYHFIGIIIMLGVFSIWAVPAYFASLTVAAEPRAPKMSREWISDVMDTITGMDKFHFGEWIMNIIAAFSYLCPWLVFTLAVSGKISLSRKADDEAVKPLTRMLFWAFVAGFILLCLLPGTRARYFMPLAPLSAILCGYVLSTVQAKEKTTRLWWNLLVIISILSILTLTFLLVFSFSGLHEKVFSIPRFKNTLPYEAPGMLISATVAMLTVLAVVIFIRFRLKDDRNLKLSFWTAVFITIIMLQFSVFAMPVVNMFASKRPVCIGINKVLPEKEILYIYNFEYQPFVYYLRPPVKYIFGDSELTSPVKYMLVESGVYDGNKDETAFALRKHEIIHEFKFKKIYYLIIKFND